ICWPPGSRRPASHCHKRRRKTMTMHEEAPYVLVARDKGVVTLTLNRGDKFNPLSEEMLSALQAELDALKADREARVVILAAAGKAFCAGHDLKQMRASPSADYYRRLFNQC